MSFHTRFIAANNAAALAGIAANLSIPASVRAILSDAVNSLSGDGPVEIEAIGHFDDGTSNRDYRQYQASTITSLKVMPVQFLAAPEPVLKAEEPAAVSSVSQGQIDAAQGGGVNAATGTLTQEGQSI